MTTLDPHDVQSPPTPGDALPHWTYSRRQFLRHTLSTAAGGLSLLGAQTAHSARLPYRPDYGTLSPVNDQSTGLPLLQLPEGFQYWSFGWTGDLMSDGVPTPGAHDGMSVISAAPDRLVLVRNHELTSRTAGSFAPGKNTYDAPCAAGTTTLTFAPAQRRWLSSWASLSGTLRNCAGGPTPWHSWISCEETVDGPHVGVARQHGYCFEVPASGLASPVPLRGMGCFYHEAAAVDPVTSFVYMTEDHGPSGLYRYMPQVRGRLSLGGRLQMMRIAGVQPNAGIDINGQYVRYYNTGVAQPAGTTWDVDWVDIDEPDRPFVSGTTYGGVRAQGLRQGACSFARGEGAWYGNGLIFFCATSGGRAQDGQVFAYDPRRETLTMLFESGGNADLDSADNITWSPRGALLVCEDGDAVPQALRGLTLDGTIFPFCLNNADFTANGIGRYVRPSGRVFDLDWREQEFTGASFHHEWLFVNIQRPGVTLAITGPWENGAL
ncbi:MAG: alkaline phosphatase PhoX [Aquabacterium sp.]